jgi:tetratricopeptide (TPR) repeat protein
MKAIGSLGFFVSRLLAAISLCLALAAPAAADEFTNNEALDALFSALAEADDPEEARIIDQQIWFYWLNPTDATLVGRMNEVLAARSMGDPAEAILLLNRLIVDYPGYAEAWNQRATMYYAIGNFEASIADCEKVLELEPRHFGALSGRAAMYMLLGKRALALKDMSTAVAIHPFLAGQEMFPELQQQREMTRI